MYTQAWKGDWVQADRPAPGEQTPQANLLMVTTLGTGSTETRLEPPPHAPAPHPVLQRFQVQLVPDTGQGVDGLAQHCGEESRGGVRRAPRAGSRAPQPGIQNSPFTFPPVTRHFMLSPATNPGLACYSAETGDPPAAYSRTGFQRPQPESQVLFPRAAPSRPAPASLLVHTRRLGHVRKTFAGSSVT